MIPFTLFGMVVRTSHDRTVISEMAQGTFCKRVLLFASRLNAYSDTHTHTHTHTHFFFSPRELFAIEQVEA